MVAPHGPVANQHAAIVAEKGTTNTNARKSNQTGLRGKIIRFLWTKTATFLDLGGMEVTPIHGASGMSIAGKHTTLL